MKRDLDLARQLLLDIENRGTDCSVSVLRSSTEYDGNESHDERIRHHLRLLIDAGLLKEIDRTSTGVPCVRLTHSGYELLELARQESIWRDAKRVCQERAGGLSLKVLQNILLHWALADSEVLPRARHLYASRRPRYEPEQHRRRLAYRVEPYRAIERWGDRDVESSENVRYVRVKPTISEHPLGSPRYGVDLDGDRGGIDVDGDGRTDYEYDATLPTYLI